MPVIYDDQKEKSSGAEYDGLGVDKKPGNPSSAEVDELEKLDENRNTTPQIKEKMPSGSATAGSAASFVTNLAPKATPAQFLAKIAKSRGGAAGGIIAILITAVSIVGIIQAPNFIINHLRETLLGNISEVQTNQSLRYRGLFMTPEGRRATALAAELEKRGYIVQVENGKIASLATPGPNSRALTGNEISREISDYMEETHPLRTSRWKTKQMNSFYDYYKISRKSVIAQVEAPVEDPERVINKAIAQEVLTDDTGNVRFSPGDSDNAEGEQSDIDRQNDEYRQIVEGDGAYDDIKNKLKEGTPIEELSGEERLLLNVHDELTDDVIRIAENASTGGSVAGRTLGSVRSIFSSTDILDKVCTVKKRLKAVQIAARVYRAQEMAKYAALFIKASDDSRRGNVDPALMNSLMKRITAVDANGNAIGASPGFAYAVKNKFSKSQNNAFKGTFAVDGKLEGFPGELNRGFNRVPFTSDAQCNVVQNVGFQLGAAAVEIGAGVVSGGSSAAASSTAKVTIKEAVEAGIKSLVTKQAAKSFAKAITVEISFEAIMALTQLYAEKSLAVNFTGQEKGGQLGNILVGGSGVLNKQRSLQAGMVPATTRQYAQAQRESIELKYAMNKQKGWYERTLDMNNPDSLVFGVAHTVAYSPGVQQGSVSGAVSNLGSGLASGLQNISGVFGRSFLVGISPRAAAQVVDEVETETTTVKGNDLVTDPAGNFLPVIPQEIQNIDPIKNKRALISSGDIDPTTEQPMSEVFKKHVDYCVENVDTLGVIESEDQSKPEFDCLASQRKTQQFKAHLAYLDMNEGVDAFLFPEEIAESSAPTNLAPTTAGTGSVGQDTSSQQCKIGQDAGLGDTPQEGVKIRLCNVSGIKVNVSIEATTKSILEGAKSAGITMSGGSYRSHQSQINTRRNNCGSSQYDIYEKPSNQCRPPTARPGKSMHEWGLAIDFTQGGSTLNRGSSGFKWLQDNQASHKLINLPSEPWHWSTTGN